MKLSFGAASEEESSGLPAPEGGLPPAAGSAGGDDPPKPRRGRPPGSQSKANLSVLEGRLTDKLLEEICVPVAFVSPLAAANIEARAEATSKAAMRIAAKNPKVRKAIERAIDGSDVFTLVMFPLTTAVCVMVDFGMMGATAAPARAAGVPKYWQLVYPDQPIEGGLQGWRSNGHAPEVDRGLLADLNNLQPEYTPE